VKKGVKGDNLTPHHMPADSYMKQHGVKRNDGVAMDVEQPSPGTGGRHRRTRTYGRGADLSEAPRDALARDIKDARKVYSEDSVYTSEIRQSLQEVIQKNKELHPELFNK
jgi:toxin YxiD